MPDPKVVIGELAAGRSVQPLPGLNVHVLPRSGFLVAKVHYTVLKPRRRPAWAKAASAKYGRLGVNSWKWRREQEIDWSAASGEPVFPNWSEPVHVIEDFPIPASWPRWICYDPGGVNPHAVDWWAMDPTPPLFPLYQYRQWYKGLEMPDGTPGGYFVAADVLRIAYQLSLDAAGRPERFEALIVDPQAKQTRAVTAVTQNNERVTERAATMYEQLLDVLAQLGWGVNIQTGNNLKDPAIDELIDRMGNYPVFQEDDQGNVVAGPDGDPVPVRDPATGLPVMVPPRLFVFRSCRWTNWELKQYRWKDWSSDAVAETRNAPEEPVDKNDHAVTNLVRLVNWLRNDPIFERPPRQAGEDPDDPDAAVRRAVQRFRKRKQREAREESGYDRG